MTFSPAEIANRLNLRRRAGRYAGPCPKCGGSQASDKFVMREDGGFKCYSCEFKGDAITWLRQIEGMSCPEAHAAAGKHCAATSCAVYDTCRMGRNQRSQQPRRPQSATLPPATAGSGLRTAAARDPEQVWRFWAADLARNSERAMATQPAALEWLARRGIDQAAAERFCLGWNARSSKIDRASIGLTPEKDGKTTLWIPVGLVIPTRDAQGRIHRLRIRRTDDDRSRFLPDLKYVWIEGSGTDLLLIEATEQPARGLVVVEAELDAMACAAAHPGVDVLALGTVSASLSPHLANVVQSAPVVLVALDADSERTTGGGRTIAPGRDAARTWCATYRHARYWPVPTAKDPGDYAQAGGNLHSWIGAGLAPRTESVTPQPQTHAIMPMRLSASTEGGGAESIVIASGVSEQGTRWAIVASDAAESPTAVELAAGGVAVFTEAEFASLRRAGLTRDERAIIAAAKAAFPGGTVESVHGRRIQEHT